jgi:hypothetical protein
VSIEIAYSVIEHYPNASDAPEPFGTYLHPAEHGLPKAGDVILLRWLDGRGAYNVEITEIQEMTLHVVGSNKATTHPVVT